MQEKKRIDYLDVARCLGMFCIYLGHMGPAAGHAYAFVFTFHVPLFFFLSGCAESLSRETPWRVFAVKKLRRILLPFFAFAVLSLLAYGVHVNDHSALYPQLTLILRGCVRNTFLAGSLWFLSCLFVVTLGFDLLRRALRPWALLPVCAALYVLASRALQPSPVVQPAWPYNLDSALYYLIFYAVGYAVFPLLHRLLTEKGRLLRTARGAAACAASAYALLVFFGKDPLSAWAFHPVLALLYFLLQPLVLIYLTLYLSRWLTHVPPMVAMGRDSLYLCGSEFLIKLLIPAALSLIGLEIVISQPFAAYVYAAVCMAAAHYLLTPVEKGVLKRVGGG